MFTPIAGQRILFEQYRDPIKLKEGKTNCPCCGKLMRAQAKTLDKRLIKLAWDILVWLQENRRRSFKAKEVWQSNDEEQHNKINDFQKLHYWKIIEKTKAGWVLTRRGYRFLTGEIQIPRRLWVFNNKVIETDDLIMTRVDNADERWQNCRADYVQDFVPYKYETEF